MAHCRLPLVDPWTLGPHSTWSTCVFSYINILWIKVSLNVYGSVTYRLAKIRYTQPPKQSFNDQNGFSFHSFTHLIGLHAYHRVAFTRRINSVDEQCFG